ncbi:MAG: 16S rRNA (cytidine(1402)-2'-O)-methyltransferase [Gammaproteobacteria bacterium]|nr:16S rRNA (cytidine(1402)-2'-O)-methyltransferase [Gammaproteobacteria bacterium]MDH5242096.1 16S rRNA (cytidine(1402)-2'-O)-methyltransferase [Gammaproteobacteria bacterium]MDH5262299.1 16S rRNA (cytidine(1402)-2'-O)-methyltransferase [Gammaproteobacteria bacterium]MDH5583383.1 16S rRNA (cytidine(1402)-2'-O)-methyltransferase [Gammaproteobacteria bacterium]
MSGTLFIVATPIGNLEDLSPRARQTLADVSLIAAEDTRHTGRLLMHIGCKTRLMALHDHNEEKAVAGVLAVLLNGESVALVSDAGTPLVSDPGFRLVRAAHEHGVTVSPIPGASALTAALSAAGIPTDRFCFEGFAPAKQAARKNWLENLRSERHTLVIYESVHRIAECLADMVDVFGATRAAFIGRELTKIHEQCVHATLGELQAQVANKTIVEKGEFVIVVAGCADDHESPLEIDRLLRALADRLSAKDAAKVAAEATGLKRNALYERLLELKD